MASTNLTISLSLFMVYYPFTVLSLVYMWYKRLLHNFSKEILYFFLFVFWSSFNVSLENLLLHVKLRLFGGPIIDIFGYIGVTILLFVNRSLNFFPTGRNIFVDPVRHLMQCAVDFFCVGGVAVVKDVALYIHDNSFGGASVGFFTCWLFSVIMSLFRISAGSGFGAAHIFCALPLLPHFSAWCLTFF